MIKVSIVGATGYVGLELIRLLYNHPEVKLMHLVSHSYVGQKLSEIYPSFSDIIDTELEDLDAEALSKDSDIIFTSLPHGTSSEVISKLYNSGCKIIDMSADFRYNSESVYNAWYGVAHPNPKLLAQSVYGLPELHRSEIRNSKLIGNPGCYTTCSILALAPLVKNDLIDINTIIIDSKSGSSGAGRNPSQALHFCEVNESIKAYSVAKHRHTSEIEQELSLLAQKDIVLSFTPHLLPVNRGILSTCYANLTTNNKDAIEKAYTDLYKDEPFVIFSGTSLPELKHVVGSNYCKIGYCIDPRLNRIIIVSVIDNMIKGSAGQAIQNMNIIYDLDEKCGLSNTAWYL